MIKKKGRKPKSYYESLNDSSLNSQEQLKTEEKPVKEHKKRGRKPKGGVVVEEKKNIDSIHIPTPNIILHLNCKLNDIIEINNNIIYNPYIENVNEFNNDEDKYNYNYLDKDNTNNNLINKNDLLDNKKND